MKRTIRDGEVFLDDSRELEIHAYRWSTLVELSGGVQESRPPAEGDWTTGSLRHEIAQRRKVRVLDAVDVGLDRNVSVSGQLREERSDCARQVGDPANDVGCAPDLDVAIHECRVRRLRRVIDERSAGDLRGLDVRLVERVDPEKPAGNRDRVLPHENLRSEGPGNLDLTFPDLLSFLAIGDQSHDLQVRKVFRQLG